MGPGLRLLGHCACALREHLVRRVDPGRPDFSHPRTLPCAIDGSWCHVGTTSAHRRRGSRRHRVSRSGGGCFGNRLRRVGGYHQRRGPAREVHRRRGHLQAEHCREPPRLDSPGCCNRGPGASRCLCRLEHVCEPNELRRERFCLEGYRRRSHGPPGHEGDGPVPQRDPRGGPLRRRGRTGIRLCRVDLQQDGPL